MQVGRRPAVVSPLELRESLRVFAAARAAPLAFVGLATARTAPHKHTHLKQQPCALRDGRRRGGHAGQAGNPGHYVALVVLRVSQGEARRDCDAHWHAAMGSLLFSGSISMDHGWLHCRGVGRQLFLNPHAHAWAWHGRTTTWMDPMHDMASSDEWRTDRRRETPNTRMDTYRTTVARSMA
jgi:hypothetical protein